MRSLASEALSAAAALSLPAAILAVFPYGAAEFKASPRSRPSVAEPAAFVELTPAEEAAALKAAKASWQAASSAEPGMSPHLGLGDLPDKSPGGPILGDAAFPAAGARAEPFEYGAPSWRPSAAAGPPRKIAAAPAEPAPPAFSKEDLLNLPPQTATPNL